MKVVEGVKRQSLNRYCEDTKYPRQGTKSLQANCPILVETGRTSVRVVGIGFFHLTRAIR